MVIAILSVGTPLLMSVPKTFKMHGIINGDL